MKSAQNFSLFFPSESPDKTVDFSGFRDGLLKGIAKKFGGFSLTEVSGGWVREETGELITEKIERIDISHFSNDPTEVSDRRRFFFTCVIATYVSLKQDAIFFTVNGQSYLYSGESIAEMETETANLVPA